MKSYSIYSAFTLPLRSIFPLWLTKISNCLAVDSICFMCNLSNLFVIHKKVSFSNLTKKQFYLTELAIDAVEI